MGNMILFPAPTPTYTWCTEVLKPHLVWIPEQFGHARASRTQSKKTASPLGPVTLNVSPSSRRFPALWFGGHHRHTLVYFHGNSTDLGDIHEEMCVLSRFLQCNILALEYPGYGVGSFIPVDPQLVNTWGIAAVRWLLHLGVPPNSIIPFGRSIGTGPAAATAVAMLNDGCQPGGLVLHSPYLSIHKIVAHYSYLGTWIVGNHWDTESNLAKLRPYTPLIIIHGMNDEVIPAAHGKELLESYKVDASLKDGFFPADSPHNAYMIIEDLGIPIKNFLRTKALSRNSHREDVIVPEADRIVPSLYRRPIQRTANIADGVVPGTLHPQDTKTEKAPAPEQHIPRREVYSSTPLTRPLSSCSSSSSTELHGVRYSQRRTAVINTLNTVHST